MQHLTNEHVRKFAVELADRNHLNPSTRLYGIPRGGVPAAYLVSSVCGASIVDALEDATFIVDDIVDSGTTRDRVMATVVPGTRFDALIPEKPEQWIVFPWEGDGEGSAEDVPRRMLQFIGEDITREGLVETPARVVRSWEKLFGGYKIDPSTLVKTFGKECYDEMILLRGCEFYSTCEHHLLPFFGKAHIAYIPSDKVIGVSKLARIVECFARRAQIQERLARQIADTINEHLQPLGVAVCLEAQHFCMTARGVEKQNSVMVTNTLLGVFRERTEARAEFFSAIRGG